VGEQDLPQILGAAAHPAKRPEDPPDAAGTTGVHQREDATVLYKERPADHTEDRLDGQRH
jgi:hypothetical protein